jgi:hypothetical protein
MNQSINEWAERRVGSEDYCVNLGWGGEERARRGGAAAAELPRFSGRLAVF